MGEAQGRRRLAAIVVIDVAGFTRMMEVDEVGTLAMLKARERTVMRPTIEKAGGRIVKFLGDGALVEFASAVNAVEASLKLQRQMSANNEGLAQSRRIDIRIGINLGDVIDDGADIFGEGVNLAARIEPLAALGGIVITEKVYQEVRSKVDAGFSDRGFHTLKNISTDVRLFDVEASGDIVQTPEQTRGAREFTSIAVMPFNNISQKANDDYFSDGITEDIITELSRCKHLAVVARNTTFLHKNKPVDVKVLGRQLAADFVLEGSVKLAGSRVRVTAQLIDVETGAHVFAEKFDRELDDIFVVQDEIVESILARLNFNLLDAATTVRSRSPTFSTSAYTEWLRGIAAYRDGKDALARERWHRAVTIDPGYARAYGSLAFAYAYWRFSEPDAGANGERERCVREFAARAIAIDRNDTNVLNNVASSLVLIGETMDALRYSDLAYSISPRDIETLTTRSYAFAYAGRHEEGLVMVERVCRIEPRLPLGFISSLGECYFLTGRFDEALATYRSAPDRPDYFRLNEALCLTQLARVDEAMAIRASLPATFDLEVYARNTVQMCMNPGARESWCAAFRLLGVDI